TAIISDDGSKLLQVEVEINVDSIWTDDPSATNEKLTGHLKSGDFFDAANHPKAKFVSTEIKAGGEGGTHTLTGNLTMRGITKGISFPANVTLQGGKLTADAAFKVNRKDFGMKYDGKADNLIRDDVGITLKVSAS
ncbi:MAG: YceI family protein, partial [Planctomycetes bacterium]|nr:YceI family protein [Planctomycetota bacterium]